MTTKVYAVIGGTDLDGSKFHTLRLFDCFSTADAYCKHLVDDEGFDYALCDTRQVSYDSALATA
jgi:hypothetical protein